MTLNKATPSKEFKRTQQSQTRTPSTENFPAQTIPLGRDMRLIIEPIELTFTLPHRYHERLQHEVKHRYQSSQILLNRRVGYLGSHQPVRYSLLAYLQRRYDHEVKIRGAALCTHEAWRYKALIPLKDLGVGLAKILEHIAALPIHSAVPLRISTTERPSSFCDTA